MKCAFCLEEMNDGASVCKVCARTQPVIGEVTEKRRNDLIFYGLGATIIGIVVVGAIWLISDSWAREHTVNKIVDCLHSKGDRDASASFVNFEIDDAMKQTGKGWRASLVMAAMFTTKYFSPQLGLCYLRPDNIISEMKGN